MAADEYFRAYSRRVPAQPEKALMLALLKDAVDTLLNVKADSAEAAKRLRETRQWIWNDKADDIFSFAHVCEVLGLDPAYVRSGLRRKTADRHNVQGRRTKRSRN